ncbi:hypothetical protein G7Z17_g7937 [Cylindrodendrum hubeiense]|uniref:Membrane insertase YidC/Oxa/ALB C-terminal domain-containing protein n=1 Tax=Cylindrodendrum hubeiense TaxID=595255 RepID=A0A9P5LF82_9HYPO|nr:hypothetical protein G7Z17_g7937 [Cylindrodendrum hubeiense]
MSSDEQLNHLSESGVTIRSDSELYSAEELSSPASSNSPIILYKPPTVWSLVRGAAINLLLPFINGMMLGFGELFAHEAAFRLGWGGTKVFPLSRRRAHPIGPGIELRDRFEGAETPLKLPNNSSASPPIYVSTWSKEHRAGNFLVAHIFNSSITLSTHAAAMLPSRGIVRSLPSGAFQRQLASQSISRTIPRRLGDGRQFGTAMKSPRAALLAGSRVGARGVAAPAVLGGARTLSLWGYGKKTEPVAEAVTTTTIPETPVQSTVVGSSAAPDAVATPAEIVASAPPAVADSPVLPTDLDLTSIADLGSASILNMPEDLGFLSAIGLDYGWGPTSVMQWVLEHVHVYSGWGWGGSIIATALILRAVMFYPQVRSLRFNAAMNLMRQDPRGKEAMDLVKKGYQTGDREILQKGQFLNKMVREQYGAYNSGMLWSFVQIPFSFGLFRIIGGMSNIPVPSLETSGYLWFSDLTASDPYFILPALGSGLLFGAMLVNSKYAPASQKAMMKKMMWVFGTVGFIGTTFLSAGVNLMMVSTGSATLLQAVVLNNASVRSLVGLPILTVEEVKYEAPRPTSPGITGLRERLTNNLGDMKKSVSDQVGSYTGNYAGTEKERAEKKRKENMRKLEDMRKQLERDQFQKKYKGQ